MHANAIYQYVISHGLSIANTTDLYSSAHKTKYVNRIVTVAVVRATTNAVKAKKPKA
jgi:hypothetical protein